MPIADTYTSLLHHFDGANGSAVLPDSSPKMRTRPTVSGTASLSTSTKKFGTASCSFGVSSNARGTLRWPDSADFKFGSGDFTIDFWAQWNSVSGNQTIYDKRASSAAFRSVLIFFNGTSLNLYASSNGTSWDIANAVTIHTPTVDSTFHHYAVVRSGSTWSVYVDGSRTNTFTSSATISDDTTTLTIGDGQSASVYFRGWLDEFRVSKGIARWTGSSFTPPTARYDSGVTWADGAGNFSSGTSATGPSVSAQAGDFLVCQMSVKATSSSFSVGNGWTLFTGTEQSQASLSTAMAWKVAEGNSNDQPNWSWSGTGTWECIVFRYFDVYNSDPVGNVAFNKGGAATSDTCLSITTNRSNSTVFVGHHTNGSNASSTKPASPWITVNNGDGGDGFHTTQSAQPIAASGTVTGNTGYAWSGSKAWTTYTFELQTEAQPAATIGQTFANISQEIDVNVVAVESSIIDQTFANISQALTVQSTFPVDSDIDQTLPGVIQELLVALEIEAISITSLFFPMEQDFEGAVGGATHITQTLPGLLQEAIVVSEIVIDTIDQTLPGAIQQVLECDQTPPVIIRMTFGTMVQEFDAVVEVPTYIDMTFISMDDYPRLTEIDMTFGSGGGDCDDSSSNSRSGWWAGP